jgi:hypothetical protein
MWELKDTIFSVVLTYSMATRLCVSRSQVAGRAAKVLCTHKVLRLYYGTFTGLIDNQSISQNYHNSAGGPVVAFASATWLQNSGNSNYNSLQVSAERRARDLSFL